jgi:hypothetical protein
VSNVIFENVEDIELGLLQISANDIRRVTLVKLASQNVECIELGLLQISANNGSGGIIYFQLHLGSTLPIL